MRTGRVIRDRRPERSVPPHGPSRELPGAPRRAVDGCQHPSTARARLSLQTLTATNCRADHAQTSNSRRARRAALYADRAAGSHGDRRHSGDRRDRPAARSGWSRLLTYEHGSRDPPRGHTGMPPTVTGYGSPWLGRATACASGLRYVSAQTLPRVPRSLLQLPYLIAFLLAIPRTQVRLSGGPSGERIRAHLQLRRWGLPRFRLAQGVLHLPTDFATYMRGRRRQALRTNVSRARSC